MYFTELAELPTPLYPMQACKGASKRSQQPRNNWTEAMGWNVQKRQPKRFQDRTDSKIAAIWSLSEPTPETKNPITMDGLFHHFWWPGAESDHRYKDYHPVPNKTLKNKKADTPRETSALLHALLAQG